VKCREDCTPSVAATVYHRDYVAGRPRTWGIGFMQTAQPRDIGALGLAIGLLVILLVVVVIVGPAAR